MRNSITAATSWADFPASNGKYSHMKNCWIKSHRHTKIEGLGRLMWSPKFSEFLERIKSASIAAVIAELNEYSSSVVGATLF